VITDVGDDRTENRGPDPAALGADHDHRPDRAAGDGPDVLLPGLADGRRDGVRRLQPGTADVVVAAGVERRDG
jgi:hypothetical protein